MDIARIVKEIDTEIARLASARNILIGSNSRTHAGRNAKVRPSRRPAGAKPAIRLSAAGRKRLSDLMKKRWAERRKKAAEKRK